MFPRPAGSSDTPPSKEVLAEIYKMTSSLKGNAQPELFTVPPSPDAVQESRDFRAALLQRRSNVSEAKRLSSVTILAILEGREFPDVDPDRAQLVRAALKYVAPPEFEEVS